ncbi:MAG TPA: uroporphyrinogen-III C-methyltransferase, partial [Pyrodictiaceae archaeon]|nr:uroporphyrinogen-III C-methyltransferase [Pyrodictiaceae archaeon]
PREILREAKPSAKLVFVGKAPGKHVYTQDEINKMLVEEACKGKIVVRLKGGDPYVFGRGEEECMYVLEHGVPCEVVPGITSAIAGPAYAGIPVTHRGTASSFAIVTGREALEKNKRMVYYGAIARAVDTLVIVMGVTNLENIVREILDAGVDPETPVAIVEKATMPEQRVVIGKLADIVEKARKAGVKPPAVIVVGEVVRLRDKLWKLA